MASTDTISHVLGLASSAAWVGAQFPQLWTNYRLQSADGLALPFLANWFAGDSTNLIGCVLTNQLPFQTYLATYFVWIDGCLLIQYMYYEWYRAPRDPPKLEVDTAVAPLTASPTISVGHLGASTSSLPGRPPRSRMRSHSYTRQPLPLPEDLHDEIGDDHPAMTESFHSEHYRGASLADRGRALDRGDAEAASGSRRKRISQTSGRGASLVFLAVFGLWGFSMGRGRIEDTGLAKIGRVLSRSVENTVHPSVYFTSSSESTIPLHYVPSPAVMAAEGQEQLPPTAPPPPSDDEPDRTSWTWRIGRISAWICTTLYLTSRMPQIWKNYTRQSVDGLSISLFVCAFLGNFFYVGSVLTSARMFGTDAQRMQYLRDSLPYLLGSAGTFIFDFAIVTQSFIYRGLRPVKVTHGEPRRRYSSARVGEEDGLLSGHRRSRSMGWSQRSPSASRGRASLDRYAKGKMNANMRASVERTGSFGYGATQNNAQAQSGA
ncbi:unnamed protein product [Rhizoctonia solani]|uniref:Uncharacterized protein n=3 Tax=Rhizoctonia solani TaxID=456999 RepID=A0A8H3AZU3_9AGAM|nr:vacuolar integral membrane protein, putative [Rhizoctonia solani AG-3 Rhs1AP]KEP55272.1 vacuolar integral membrane protein [Rhizoctonia solani 123E]CAE6444450.1 unnamed protein product [Rhizoctonia solani]CAE6508605.1 unnamed protein product [Rhizoctonia solani]